MRSPTAATSRAAAAGPWRAWYAAWAAASALAVLTGQHRLLYAALGGLGAPELVTAALTGLAGLAWHELAYVLGSALRSAQVFEVVPLAGAAAGLAGAASLAARSRWAPLVARLHLAAGLVVGGLGAAVLLRRAGLGFGDPWRLVAAATFLLAHAGWLLAWARGPRRVAAPLEEERHA